MAFDYGFFDAELIPGSEDMYDREYAAEHFAKYFAMFISNGVFPDPATQMQVRASSTPDMNVSISVGNAWINGYYGRVVDVPFPLAIQAASGTLNRIDSIVLRWEKETRRIWPYVKTGTAAGTPTAPTLTRNDEIYEIELATITVSAGTTAIAQAMITDKRPDNTVCGWVTGVVDQIDTTELFAQYDDAFQTWFNNIKSQLEENIVTNLQRQIDALQDEVQAISELKVNISDMATLEDIKNNVPGKWISSDRFEYVLHTEVITETGIWQRPTGTLDSIHVLLFGGGGGGGGIWSNEGGYGGGGGSGYLTELDIDLKDTTEIPVTIGNGGSMKNNGGTTSFGTYGSALGGRSGNGSNGGDGGAGGGGGGGYWNGSNYTFFGGNGGNGEGYGGGGGGGGGYGNSQGRGGSGGSSTYKGQTFYGGNGGSGASYQGGGGGGGGGSQGNGGNGGNGSSNGQNTNGVSGDNGIDTLNISGVLFPGTGLGGIGGRGSTESCSGAGGGGGGGYGGNGGTGNNGTLSSSSNSSGAGGGGGGGYGGNGGNGAGGGQESTVQYTAGGGGGGGYGGNGGNGLSIKMGGAGGGGGGYGPNNYGAGGNGNSKGNSGCCVILYYKLEGK